MSQKKSTKKGGGTCLKCGKPGATHYVVTGDNAMKGPYHPGCKP